MQCWHALEHNIISFVKCGLRDYLFFVNLVLPFNHLQTVRAAIQQYMMPRQLAKAHEQTTLRKTLAMKQCIAKR
eukprot:3097-Heterococcus_DN1.PRE.2